MHRYKKAAGITGILLIVVIFFLIINHFTGTICLLNAITGIPCPGCGLTRAGVLALQGRFTESFTMHPLLFPALAVMAFMFIYITLLKKKPSKLFYTIIALCLILFVGLYIWRMATLFPDTPPMTINENSLLRQLAQH